MRAVTRSVEEVENDLLPTVPDGDLDPDADLLSNLKEFVNHSDPQNPDTDQDGLNDGKEVLEIGTRPDPPR